MKKIKSTNKKASYTTGQNIQFTMSNMWKWDKFLVFLVAVQVPLKVLVQLSALYIVRLVISLIENKADPINFVLQVSFFAGVIFLLNAAGNLVTAKIQWRQHSIRFNYMAMVNRKTMDTDYENIENPDGMNKMQKAISTVTSETSATQTISNTVVYVASSILSILSLFTIITALSPVLLISITAITLIQHFINQSGYRWHYKSAEKWAPIDRKINYINYISGDFDRAKDIRLYGMKSWLQDVFNIVLGDRVKWYNKEKLSSFLRYDLNQGIINVVLCNGITFIYLIRNVTGGRITVADAAFYFSAIGTLSGVIMDVIRSAGELHAASLSLCHLREFLDMPDLSNRGKGVEVPHSAVEIQFSNVSFAYPQSDENAINDISFTVSKGEKIAIVGANGAGKTTLVKLMCGLYRPSAGSIKINGNEISQYNRDQYYEIISPVFQDIYLYPVSIAQNIALCDENCIDRQKLIKTIDSAGLQEKIRRLPEGTDTYLLKGILDNAIELSGGEKQKLSLARALYKDGLLLILDEPTAALDPIAENEMYLKYSSFSEGKTSVFISHRLSSTRFCDRIFFVDGGRITESGSHDELMALNGKYAEIFNIQSYYYKEV